MVNGITNPQWIKTMDSFLSWPPAPVPGLGEEVNVHIAIHTEHPMICMERKTNEAEDVDLISSIHSKWTVEDAKARLHMFL